ncbi:MAG TPA: response regulator transcription factor [Acetivibrio sp.]|nr:response regulator transcription factor [Clostridium sp.]HOQ38348.1 response regulator transcription factor [Acetivibrio sp.]HQA57611.1 response regulator transcription factor [Acetivibrio sp.]
MGAKVLTVEDDNSIRGFLVTILKKNDFIVSEAVTGKEALRKVELEKPEVILLDIMLPDIDGFEVCKKVSQLHPEISIIMLTARGADMDKINGLELGADDYIIKPFNPMEVIARIRAIIRRTNKTDSSNAIEIDPFKIDFNTQKVYKNGHDLELTPTEFCLMKVFANNINKSLTRDDILNWVWGENYIGDTKTVDVHIRRLRGKIEDDPSNPKYIETVWGHGYMWRKGD